MADPNLSTLLDFRHAPHYRAENGQTGRGKRMSGRGGEDSIIRVPVGTVVTDRETGQVLVDVVKSDARLVVAQGGRGGKGNFHFRSATNRTPRKAQPGGDAVSFRLRLTLKLLADVGLVGLPNAGKSTLLSRISKARPKIADYPFTTLVPNLGIVEVRRWQTFVVADIPGIVEGAHEGRGLGLRFLRHIERTRVLAFLIDIDSPDPGGTYAILTRELAEFSPILLRKPRLLIYTKTDLDPTGPLPPSPDPDLEVHGVSAVTGAGLAPLIEALYRRVRELDESVELAEPVDRDDAPVGLNDEPEGEE